MTAVERLSFFGRITSEQGARVPPCSFGAQQCSCSRDELHGMWRASDDATCFEPHASFYTHVPFCHKRRCTFCMYASSTDYTTSDLSDYRRYVARDLAAWSPLVDRARIRNLYVGGGTPSVYSPEDLGDMLSRFRDFEYEPLGERTCEMSPTTATEEHVRAVAGCGINRLSLGIQSFDPSVAAAINRDAADADHVRRLCACARECSFVDVNLDLMLGIPGISEANLRDSVRLVQKVGALSASVYYWRQTDVPRARLKWEYDIVCEEMRDGGWSLESGSAETEYHLFFSPERRRDTLRYVTSGNCIDNMRVVGLGIHAHGFRPALSYTCSGENLYQVWCMDRSAQQRMAAANMLYHNDGVLDKRLFRKAFGEDASSCFASEIEELRCLGAILETDGELKLVGRDEREMLSLQKFFWDIEYLLRRYGGAKA